MHRWKKGGKVNNVRSKGGKRRYNPSKTTKDKLPT